MTGKQKTIVAGLAIANLAIIAGLALLITRPPGPATSMLPTPARLLTSPAPAASPSFRVSPGAPPLTPTLPTFALEACQRLAAQRLSQAGLSGAVALIPGDSLHLDIVYALAPGQTPDEAAQAVWIAFDAALAVMTESACAAFDRAEVAVLAHGDQADVRIRASVAAEDLAAYEDGRLSEDAFIDRVTYSVEGP